MGNKQVFRHPPVTQYDYTHVVQWCITEPHGFLWDTHGHNYQWQELGKTGKMSRNIFRKVCFDKSNYDLTQLSIPVIAGVDECLGQ